MYLFEDKIDRLLAEEHIAGAVVALTDARGVLYARGFGVESVERPSVPVTASSLHRIASITKVVTGVTTMRLVEEGRLSLDTPIVDYLPWFTLCDERARDAITARHLISHTAGLPMEYTPIGPKDEGMLVPSLMSGLVTLDLAYFPGEGYLYSNWGIRLLSAVLEAVSGKRYSELAKEYVIDPLGMDMTTFDLNVAATYPMSLPHDRDEDGRPVVSHYMKENATRLATGGLYSNATDLLKLARLILRRGIADDGTRVILEPSLAAMMTPISTTKSGDSYGMALQWHHTAGGLHLWGHYGNADPYTSALMTDPEHGLGVAVLINTYSRDLRATISDMVLEEIVGVG